MTQTSRELKSWDRLARQAALTVADCARGVAPMRACGNTDAANAVACGAMVTGLFSNIKDHCVVVKITDGRGDGSGSLPKGMVATAPAGNQPTLDAIVDPLENAAGFARRSPADRDSMVVLALAQSPAVPNVDGTLRCRYVVGPPGSPEVDLGDKASVVLDAFCAAFGCRPRQVNVTILQRPWTDELIKDWEETEATVELIRSGDFEAIIDAAHPVQPGGPIRIVVGTGGVTETFATIPYIKSTGATMSVQVIPKGMEMSRSRITGPVMNPRSMITTDYCLLAVAGLSEATATAQALVSRRFIVPGIRQCHNSGKIWISVLVASPLLDRMRRYVVEYQAGSSPIIRLLHADETLDEHLVGLFVASGQPMETRIDESKNLEWFQHWFGSFVPGLSQSKERELIDLLHELKRKQQIDFLDFATSDPTQFRRRWSAQA